jgi:uncharacterized damage-inducible protein DinB
MRGQKETLMKLRIFMILCCLPLSVAAVFGQSTPEKAPDALIEIRKGFEEVNGWVTKAADMVPAEKYNYRPVDSVRTFGQLVAHITDSYNYFCAHGVGNKVEWVTPVEDASTDKDKLLPKLKEAVGRCNAAYGSDKAQFGPLFTNLGHTSLHYGNIITYMRMMGLKPPSS